MPHMIHLKPPRITTSCVTVTTDKEMWTVKTFQKLNKHEYSNKTWIFCTYSCQKVFPIYHIPLENWSSIDLDWLQDLEKIGRSLAVLSWDSDLSLPLSLERDLVLLQEKLLLSWRLYQGGILLLNKSSWRQRPPGGQWATILTYLFTFWQFHFYLAATWVFLPSKFQTASCISGIFKFHKSKAWRVSCNPHTLEKVAQSFPTFCDPMDL